MPFITVINLLGATRGKAVNNSNELYAVVKQNIDISLIPIYQVKSVCVFYYCTSERSTFPVSLHFYQSPCVHSLFSSVFHTVPLHLMCPWRCDVVSKNWRQRKDCATRSTLELRFLNHWQICNDIMLLSTSILVKQRSTVQGLHWRTVSLKQPPTVATSLSFIWIMNMKNTMPGFHLLWPQAPSFEYKHLHFLFHVVTRTVTSTCLVLFSLASFSTIQYKSSP